MYIPAQVAQMSHGLSVVADLTKGDAEMQRAVKETIDAFGGLDIVVNRCAWTLSLWIAGMGTLQCPSQVADQVLTGTMTIDRSVVNRHAMSLSLHLCSATFFAFVHYSPSVVLPSHGHAMICSPPGSMRAAAFPLMRGFCEGACAHAVAV